MIALAAVPLLLAVAVRAFAGRLSAQLRPGVGVPLVTALALTVALCTGIVLSVLAVLVVVQLGPLPRLGGWSAQTVHARSGLPRPVGLAALVVVVVLLAAAVLRAARSVRDLLGARRAARSLLPVADRLVLIEDAEPIAYAVAGDGGRVVVSTSMLAALPADERRVLIAHEHAHLRYRHHLYVHLTRLAVAANPLLRPAAEAVTAGVERWADEAAADEVGDRGLAARALARAALARSAQGRPAAGLAAADSHVVERVQALLAAPRRQSPYLVGLVLAAGALSWAAAAAVTLWADGLVQLAERVYLSR